MLSTTFLRWLKRGSGSGRRSPDRRPRAARRLAFVPRLLLLEDRTLPSTFTVTNLGDSGLGSLRQAVLDANAHPGADTIRFAHRLRGTITLTSGQLDITDDLTIRGPGADGLAISGSDASRVFAITAGVTVGIDQLTITQGRASAGGGVLNDGGSLTLSHVVLSDNRAIGIAGVANGFGNGGAIRNQSGATLAVSHSTFTGNQALGADGGPGVAGGTGRGGGIYNAEAALLVTHSTFAGNRAAGRDRGPGAGAGLSGGAGIENGGSNSLTTLTVSDRTFTDNRSAGGAGGAGGRSGFGGAIANLGG